MTCKSCYNVSINKIHAGLSYINFMRMCALIATARSVWGSFSNNVLEYIQSSPTSKSPHVNKVSDHHNKKYCRLSTIIFKYGESKNMNEHAQPVFSASIYFDNTVTHLIISSSSLVPHVHANIISIVCLHTSIFIF